MEEAQKSVYVRVKNVYLPRSATTPPDTRTLLCHLLPQEDGCIAPLLGAGVLTTTSTWIFHFADASSTYIGFLLKDFIENQEYEIARLVLPISWYPVDKVVTLQFPMTPTHKALAPVHITLEIHVASAGSTAFQAPAGRLLMTPRWQQVQVPAAGSSEVLKPQNPQNIQNPQNFQNPQNIQSPRQSPAQPPQVQQVHQPQQVQQPQQPRSPPSGGYSQKPMNQYQQPRQQVQQPQQIPGQPPNQYGVPQIQQVPQISQMQPVQPGVPMISGQQYMYQVPQQIPQIQQVQQMPQQPQQPQQNAYIAKDPADQSMQYGAQVQYIPMGDSDQGQGAYGYMPTQYTDQ